MKNRLDPPQLSSRKTAKREMKNPVDQHIPDDIFNEFLSWLPTKDVARCRCVCRRWRDQMSSKVFVDLHTQRVVRSTSSPPMVLVEEFNRLNWKDRKKHLLDKWWVTKGNKSKIHDFHGFADCSTCFSMDGFVVLKSPGTKEIILFNPINHGTAVRIVVVPENMFFLTNLYGIFFNPKLKEYCAFFRCNSLYRMVNLGSKPCWREIRMPFNHKFRFLSGRPLVIQDYLYFLSGLKVGYLYPDNIMEFDINNEVFTSLSCPVPKTAHCSEFGLDLLNIDGFLSLVLVRICSSRIDISIWTLIDRTQRSWTSSSNYGFSLQVPARTSRSKRPRAIAVVDEELLIYSGKKLIVCNLKLETARYFAKNNYTDGTSFFPHVVSLASFKNCKSRISLDWEKGVDHEGDLPELG